MITADAVTIQSQPTMRHESQQGRQGRACFLYEDAQGMGVIKLPPDWTWQLEPIKKILGALLLPENWDSYGGHTPKTEAAETAIQIIASIVHEDPPRPRVVPLGTGGIQLEWKKGARELEVECGPNGSVEALKVEGDAEGELCPTHTSADVVNLFAWLMAA
jgi:hypothetical protein